MSKESVYLKLKIEKRLPSIKGVALSLLEACVRDDVTLSRLADILKPDPALTGRVIEKSNVAALGGKKVTSLLDALSKLGMSQVKMIALGFSLITDNQKENAPFFDYSRFWGQSLLTGALFQSHLMSHQVAMSPPIDQETAFTLGLLSQIGTLSLSHAYGSRYPHTQWMDDPSMSQLEQQEFGISSSELTQEMLRDWGFPSSWIDSFSDPQQPIHDLLIEFHSQALLILDFLKEQFDSNPQFHYEQLPNDYPHLMPLRIVWSWLEELEILRKMTPRHQLEKLSQTSKERATPVSDHMDLKILVATQSLKALKTIGQMASVQNAQMHALRHEDRWKEELLEFHPDGVWFDFDPEKLKSFEEIKRIQGYDNFLVFFLCQPDQIDQALPMIGHGIDGIVLLDPLNVKDLYVHLNLIQRLNEFKKNMQHERWQWESRLFDMEQKIHLIQKDVKEAVSPKKDMDQADLQIWVQAMKKAHIQKHLHPFISSSNQKLGVYCQFFVQSPIDLPQYPKPLNQLPNYQQLLSQLHWKELDRQHGVALFLDDYPWQLSYLQLQDLKPSKSSFEIILRPHQWPSEEALFQRILHWKDRHISCSISVSSISLSLLDRLQKTLPQRIFFDLRSLFKFSQLSAPMQELWLETQIKLLQSLHIPIWIEGIDTLEQWKWAQDRGFSGFSGQWVDTLQYFQS